MKAAYVGCGRFALYAESFKVKLPDMNVTCSVAEHDGRLVLTALTIKRRSPGLSINDLKSLPLVTFVGHALRGEPELDGLSEVQSASVIYRTAMLFGFPPTVAVAERLNLTHDVAAKRVQAARLVGLLAPTSRGKKGEAA